MKDHLNDLANDLRDFGEGVDKQRPVVAKDMQLRDYFAGQVMPDLVIDYGFAPEALDVLAWRAYMIADALMRERLK